MLARKGRVIRKMRGYCLRAEVPPPPTDLRIENMLLIFRGPKSDKTGSRRAGYITVSPPAEPPKPKESKQLRIDDLERVVRREHHRGFDRDERRTFFRVWPVYIEEYANGTTTLKLWTRGIPGLSPLDLVQFAGWLEGTFPEIPLDKWTVQSWEWNRDFSGLRIDRAEIGGKAITFRVFQNLIVKLYEKVSGLRVELRHMDVRVSMDKAGEVAHQVGREYLQLGLIRVEKNSGPPGEDG